MVERSFIETEGELVGPPPPTSNQPRPSLPSDLERQVEKQERFADLLPYGTTVAGSWSDTWIQYVSAVEKEQGRAICGARRTQIDMDSLIRSGKISEEETQENVLSAVCTFRAGLNTAHPGEGRCYKHGGNSNPTAKFSLLSHSGMSKEVREFFENEDLLDLRGAIAMVWSAANSITTDDEGNEKEKLSVSDAKEIGALMSRIGNLTKQHNEIMEKRKISIEVPEFIAWAEHFYELAVKFILDGEKDVKGFLQEAQTYYNATVTLKVGIDNSGNSNRAGHPFGGNQTPALLGSGESES